jgi:phage/plasmid-like protein (TIGR03299 family)
METAEWLNRNVLIGYTRERGNAWHYRSAAQGDEPNHYPGPIPVADIQRRLFHWRAIPGRVLTHTDLHGLRPCPDRMAVVADDTGEDLGIFMKSYEIHQFQDWLLEKVSALLDGGLSAGSAGLLKNRAQAWVSVEVPDTVQTPEGVQFRPHLLACTSHDGSLSTTYKRTVTNVVCDNTMGAALRGAGQVIKIKHKKGSRQGRLEVLSARQALDMVEVLADEFADEVRELCQVDVTEAQWQDFLLAHAPDTGSQRSRTFASNRRTKLVELWQFDNRVAPWRGTAWGVLQAVNTYEHHHATVRGASRPERNLTRSVTDHADSLDSTTLATLDAVLAAA